MRNRGLKTGYFVLEGMNAFATTFYYYYLFFFMAREFGFGNRDNLLLSALNGFVYMFAARLGGRFGQRFGYFSALALGFVVMTFALITGAFMKQWFGQIIVLGVWTLGICFTWANLVALISEHKSPSELPRTIGIYNVVWAASGSLAFFSGGALLEVFGPRTLFWLPVGLHLTQLVFLVWLKKHSSVHLQISPATNSQTNGPPALNPRPISRTRTFLKLAWLANPFAYVAINTIVAVIPGISQKLKLTPTSAGVVCSIWFFARLGTFAALWRWHGWHYRLRWFLGAYGLLILGFGAILLVPKLPVLIIAQIGFGMGLGLIYFSSLFYSMDVGETKAEHGGMHESAIGAGIFVGPAIGAATLYLAPDKPHSGALAVGALLILGFLAVIVVALRHRLAVPMIFSFKGNPERT